MYVLSSDSFNPADLSCQPLTDDTITVKELRPFLAKEGASAVLHCLEHYTSMIENMKEQSNEGFSPAPKLTRADFLIKWTNSSQSIYNQWRALSSLRTCIIGSIATSSDTVRELTITELKPASKVLGSASPVLKPGAESGSLVYDKKNDLLWVKCGSTEKEDWLAISRLQMAGKKASPTVGDFVNGIQLKRNPTLRFDSTSLIQANKGGKDLMRAVTIASS